MIPDENVLLQERMKSTRNHKNWSMYLTSHLKCLIDNKLTKQNSKNIL